MRTIYLIRHAAIQRGGRCIGTTDLPLSSEGHGQGRHLAELFRDIPLTALFSSDLKRALQTARYVRPDPIPVPALREMDAGEWEGLPFAEIEARWPELYARRGEDHTTPIPGGESFASAQLRFRQALDAIVAQTTGDIAIVSHGSILQLFLSELRGESLTRMRDKRIPWGGFVAVGFDGTYHTLAPLINAGREND